MRNKRAFKDMEKLFNPKSVAVIGASNTPGKVGYAIVRNLIEADFSGEIFPINLNEKEIQGLAAFPSVLKVEKPIDAAIICVPAAFVPSVMKECAQKGIKSAVVITAGFSETGAKGKKLEEEMRKIAEKNKMAVIGPNTLGVINTANGFNGSFATTFPQRGNIAVVSQSGALCTALLDWARQEKIGFSKFISTGNKVFLDEADYFGYLKADEETKAVLAYMESVKNPQAFLREAVLLAKKKPVVILKAGRSAEGQKAAASHTGALSVDDEIFTVACKKANVIRINSIEGFFDMAKLLSKINKVRGFRLAVVTNAGGPGVIAADAASANKFVLPKFSPKTIKAVKQINPNPSNPLDLIGDAQPIDYRTALKTLQDDSAIDLVYTLLTPQSMTNPERVADIVISLNQRKPIICSFLGGTTVAHPKKHLKESGVVEFDTPERGIKALSRLEQYYSRKNAGEIFSASAKPKASIRKMLSGKKTLSMEEAFAMLNAHGIKAPRTVFASNMKEFEKKQKGVKFPVAVKSAVGLAHKTDLGLVKLNIKNKEELGREMEKMGKTLKKLKYSPRFAVQEMKPGEFVLVSAIDSEFGKVITYGLGGIFVEVLKDFSQRIAPITKMDIEGMFGEVKGTKILLGARTKKKYDIEGLKRAIKAVSAIAMAYPQIKELELNPVMVREDGCFAVDAVVTLK